MEPVPDHLSPQMSQEIISGVPQTVIIDIGLTQPPTELTRLCRAIETVVSGNRCHVIQFISAYAGEGSSVIAFETAMMAGTLLGKRVLYIDSQPKNRHQAAKKLSDAVQKPLDTPFDPRHTLKDAIVMVARTKLFYGTLRRQDEHETQLPNIDAFQSVLAVLRQSFDLIIIDSPAILTNVFSTVLAKLSDGCVIVIQAERTRAPVILQAVQLVEASGGHVLGAVLNKRRYYIPQWLYRILYR